MIHNLGEGYYGVEATGRAISPAVLDRINQAYDAARAIPDDAIIITDYQYKTTAAISYPPAQPLAQAQAFTR